MYYEAVLGLFLPAGCLGVLVASMVFYMIVKKSPKMRAKLEQGTPAQRELLYGYLGMEERKTRTSSKKKPFQKKRRSAQLYDFEYERRKRG